MTDLRADLIEAIAWMLYTPDCEPVAPADFCPACGQEAERILDDAVLDTLADRADEWIDAAMKDYTDTAGLTRYPRLPDMIAVLRGDE